MTTQLTEKMICERANEQSFSKGRDYYNAGAIYDSSWQSIPGGVILMARCEGSSASYYRLRVELDTGGVRMASCSCPYDWGGDCKHIVALLLTYLHRPKDFSEQKGLDELLAGLEKDELLTLITRLVQNDSDLYDEIEMSLPTIQLISQPKAAAQSTEKRRTQVSEQTYRKQVKRILKQSRYEEDYDYDGGNAPAYLDDLHAIQQTAEQFLAAGDAEGALIILRVLLEEMLDDYDGEMDYNGDVASFIQGLGMPMTEAILSIEMDDSLHDTLQASSIENILDDLDEVIEESDLEVILIALEFGWKQLPDKETEWEEYEEETWMLFDDLQQARLNVLERQKRTEEFLQLAKIADIHRYIIKLLDIGGVEDAIAASQELEDNSEILSIAQKLHQVGRINEAAALAERGLDQHGHRLHELALWLAPLEESLGKKDMALLVYRTAYDTHPSIEIYRCLKRLAGSNWENLRPALVKTVNPENMTDVLADIYLEEHEWNAAIALAEKQTWSYNLLEKVADAVTQHRPDWVIRVALKQANDLIVQTQSKLYPAAAEWLGRAKKAYQHKNQEAVWQAYIANLRATYARRPALQKAISHL
jgi:uncharacterized Zn finger protein